MITFDSYALEKRIDERIEDAMQLGDVYGDSLFDDNGKIRDRWDESTSIGFQAGHLIDVLQSQQEQITELGNLVTSLYNEFILIKKEDKK